MKPLSDRALERLRNAAALPDLTGTRYELRRELGRGGMGVVYLAEDTELHRQVAVKVLHLDDRAPELAARMRLEAQTLAQLEHPSIVPIYDFGQLPDHRLFYVMKYVQGQRLDALPDANLRDRLRLFIRICEAVAFAHSLGILHRDLKPENMMIGAFGEVLIMDWGLAKHTSEAESPGRVMGTPAYMSPEQERGAPVDHRADIFALGRVLQFLCAPGPKPLESIWKKAQSADPRDRYDSALDLGNDVLRHLDGQPVSAYRETAVEALARFYHNNRTLLLVIGSYIIMRLMVVFVGRR